MDGFIYCFPSRTYILTPYLFDKRNWSENYQQDKKKRGRNVYFDLSIMTVQSVLCHKVINNEDVIRQAADLHEYHISVIKLLIWNRYDAIIFLCCPHKQEFSGEYSQSGLTHFSRMYFCGLDLSNLNTS